VIWVARARLAGAGGRGEGGDLKKKLAGGGDAGTWPKSWPATALWSEARGSVLQQVRRQQGREGLGFAHRRFSLPLYRRGAG
jgi:hypothetical protein